jgi:hypothetical protein
MTVKVTIEIRFFCDYVGCPNQEVLFSGEPDEPPEEPLPNGWDHRDGKQYCPEHA